MKQFTKDDARQIQDDLALAIDRLGDDYTYAEFQQEVFRTTGKYIKADSITALSVHECVKIKPKVYMKDGVVNGLAGTYLHKDICKIGFNGHFSEHLLTTVQAVIRSKK